LHVLLWKAHLVAEFHFVLTVDVPAPASRRAPVDGRLVQFAPPTVVQQLPLRRQASSLLQAIVRGCWDTICAQPGARLRRVDPFPSDQTCSLTYRAANWALDRRGLGVLDPTTRHPEDDLVEDFRIWEREVRQPG
jgi:hypothetical protein